MKNINSSSRVNELRESINYSFEQIQNLDDRIFDIIVEREDHYREIIDSLRVIKVISFDELQISDEGTRKKFDQLVVRPIDQLCSEIEEEHNKSTLQSEPLILGLEKILTHMSETLSRIHNFKAYLSDIQRGQLDRIFHLPNADRKES